MEEPHSFSERGARLLTRKWQFDKMLRDLILYGALIGALCDTDLDAHHMNPARMNYKKWFSTPFPVRRRRAARLSAHRWKVTAALRRFYLVSVFTNAIHDIKFRLRSLESDLFQRGVQ